jgi:predicted TIM-barrel fold metal-dependent hydrolase
VPSEVQSVAGVIVGSRLQRSSPVLIDAHNHLGPDIPLLGDCRAPEELIETMDRTGVAKALVQQHVRHVGEADDLRAGLDFVAAAVRDHATRLFGCVLVHPLHAGSLALARVALARGGFRAVKIWPGADYQPTPDRLAPVMRLCRDFDVPLRIHGDIDDPRSSPLAVVGLALAYPDVPVILAHMPGEYTLDGLATVAAGRLAANLFFDTSTCPSSMIGRAIAELGPDRILWGSDSPWWDIEIELTKIRLLGLPDDDAELVTGGNAQRLFRLEDRT